MSKVRCSSCGAVFSSHRKNCPDCGNVRNKGGARIKPGTGGSPARLILVLVLILAIVLCLVILAKLMFFSDTTNEQENSDLQQNEVINAENEQEENELGLPTIIDVDDINGDIQNNEDISNEETTTPPENENENQETTPEVKVTGIKLNTLYDEANSQYDATFVNGETFQFTAKTTPEGEAVTWSVANTAVAQVTENGKLTAVGYGQTTMTVSSGGYEVRCIIRVN